MQKLRLIMAWAAGLIALALIALGGAMAERDFGPLWFIDRPAGQERGLLALILLAFIATCWLGLALGATHQHGRGEEARRQRAGESSSF